MPPLVPIAGPKQWVSGNDTGKAWCLHWFPRLFPNNGCLATTLGRHGASVRFQLRSQSSLLGNKALLFPSTLPSCHCSLGTGWETWEHIWERSCYQLGTDVFAWLFHGLPGNWHPCFQENSPRSQTITWERNWEQPHQDTSVP